jgi:hypothetical protein
MSIEAMKMALEALEQLQGGCTDSDDGTVEAITVWCPEVIDALRQAIEQVEQAPICAHGVSKLKCDFCKRPEQAQPVAWISHSDSLLSWDKFYDHMEPLYTAPPQRKPLTDEEIVKMAEANLHAFSQYIDGGEAYYEGEIDFARAIEAAHGIKE